ncbi:CRISPR-associated helicase Cas3' [Candidatus Accumulibacter vicinus]|uniref:CRISPR-associated endonuclease/helicase Cas3 n=1 Tax=Candidatus Accumulibacter vicinus TaxID=2954382 RepID=A0A084Y3X5_9PROT|nr:CRISPR-associated helicase Cas3' [Candidatus Accumulibacter vicinus]KFB69419.1 MAG: CRISPR-associated endonuclease/helicase Cas3 [Candidatus Accumulibacter vicinus]
MSDDQVLKDNEAFGKLEHGADGKVLRRHLLIDHMIDVAACFHRLAHCRSIRRAMERSAGRQLTEQDIARLAVLAFLHDVGKANSGFQAKRWRDRIPAAWPVRISAGHGLEAFKLFGVPAAAAAIEPLIERICSWGTACDSLLIASISHHGRPIKDSPGSSPIFWKTQAGTYDPAAVLKAIAESALCLYPLAFQGGGEDLPGASAFGHLFAGLVQLADWLGSDTWFFKFSSPGEVRAVSAPKLADDAITTLGLDAEDWRNRLTATEPDFARAFGWFPPHPIQAAMGDESLGPLVILESETGSGKTEAALWRYLKLFRAGEVDSLYFALPTRVAASQLYKRVQDTLQRLWPENPPLALRALPGYVAADGEEAKVLPDFKVLWSDDKDDQAAPQRWAGENSKRFLAAPVAVGTIDQALLGALQVAHAHLRHAILARSLLVVDEVHASDTYMTVLLEQLLKAHLNCGGYAVLLSATLGSNARSRYLALTPRGRTSSLLAAMPFDVACRVPYPAISDGYSLRAVGGTGRSKRVRWSTRDIIDSPEQIAELALAAATHGAKVLIVRNTVPAAIATLAALEARVPDRAWLFQVNGVVTLHHSRFSRQDRPLLDAEIELRLGKERPSGALIVVGTQTLEQSLDIDADFLITDLCPMDVLLQRVGRLHRHANERPEAYRIAQVLVLTPLGNDLTPLLIHAKNGLGRHRNGGGVYDDLRILEATRRLLDERPEVNIPDDNRYLVEAGLHQDRLLELERQYDESWRKAAQEIEGEQISFKLLARQHRLDLDIDFGERSFPTDQRISTRLGAQDRVVFFCLSQFGPFGEPLKSLPIRHYLVPKDLPLDAEPTRVTQHENGLTFRLGEATFRYSRLGLECLRDPSSAAGD